MKKQSEIAMELAQHLNLTIGDHTKLVNWLIDNDYFFAPVIGTRDALLSLIDKMGIPKANI